MKINFVVPPLSNTKFSGGILCVLKYAQGLAERGHQVNVVSYGASKEPLWFGKPWSFNYIAPPSNAGMLRKCIKSGSMFVFELLRAIFKGEKIKSTQNKAYFWESLGAFATLLGQYGSYGIKKGVAIEHLKSVLPDADVTIATDYETAIPVALIGKGKLFYFSQHYEPYFWKERQEGEIAKREAEISYRLGLTQIVNSPWLADELNRKLGINNAMVCSNAIDHDIFSGTPRPRKEDELVTIISYGGRDAEWKGFKEMCEAIALARKLLPQMRIEWSVYGEALLPPDNPIANYQSLGFLNQTKLVEAYNNHDILLSASWYESFPLFPIEAMACGLATICTLAGTEVYAINGVTVEVVQPRDPQNIAEAIVRLAKDDQYRIELATKGQMKAREFTWQSSINRLHEILANTDV